MQEMLYEHPGVTPKIQAKLEIAEAALADVYQISVRLFDGFNE